LRLLPRDYAQYEERRPDGQLSESHTFLPVGGPQRVT
jgi:hypothetical protein